MALRGSSRDACSRQVVGGSTSRARVVQGAVGARDAAGMDAPRLSTRSENPTLTLSPRRSAMRITLARGRACRAGPPASTELARAHSMRITTCCPAQVPPRRSAEWRARRLPVERAGGVRDGTRATRPARAGAVSRTGACRAASMRMARTRRPAVPKTRIHAAALPVEEAALRPGQAPRAQRAQGQRPHRVLAAASRRDDVRPTREAAVVQAEAAPQGAFRQGRVQGFAGHDDQARGSGDLHHDLDADPLHEERGPDPRGVHRHPPRAAMVGEESGDQQDVDRPRPPRRGSAAEKASAGGQRGGANTRPVGISAGPPPCGRLLRGSAARYAPRAPTPT